MTWRVPQRVGCDNVLGSDAVEDSCGVCRGNNSSCTMHKGLYAKQHRTNRESATRAARRAEQRLKCICLVGRPDGGVVETAGEPQSPTRTPGLLCFSDLLL